MRWVKKLGPWHRMNGNVTVCGRPMLGNNYDRVRVDVPNCEECNTVPELSLDDKCGCKEVEVYRFVLGLIIDKVYENIQAFEGQFESECYTEIAEIADKVLNK